MLDGQSLEDQAADVAANTSEAEKIAMQQSSLLHAVFSTPQGVQLLEVWKLILMLPVCTTPDLLAIGGIEGRNNFIREIIRSLNNAKG